MLFQWLRADSRAEIPREVREENNVMILICTSQDPVGKPETVLGVSVEGIY